MRARYQLASGKPDSQSHTLDVTRAASLAFVQGDTEQLCSQVHQSNVGSPTAPSPDHSSRASCLLKIFPWRGWFLYQGGQGWEDETVPFRGQSTHGPVMPPIPCQRFRDNILGELLVPHCARLEKLAHSGLHDSKLLRAFFSPSQDDAPPPHLQTTDRKLFGL